jgi:hypothetical protein
MSCPLQPRLPLLPLWQKPVNAILDALLRIHAPRHAPLVGTYGYHDSMITERQLFS